MAERVRGIRSAAGGHYLVDVRSIEEFERVLTHSGSWDGRFDPTTNTGFVRFFNPQAALDAAAGLPA